MNFYDEAIEDCEFLLGEHENYRILKALERAKKENELLELLLKLDDCVTVFEVRSFYERYKNDIQRLREELEELK